MNLYLSPAKITEIIGVAENIIQGTLERRDEDIEPYLRLVSAAPKTEGDSTKPQIELRIDGLGLLIKKLTYNIPTDDIIENLSCQIVHITYLQESCDRLEALNKTLEETHQSLLVENDELIAKNERLLSENKQLLEKIEDFQTERQTFTTTVNNLMAQLDEAKAKTWMPGWLKRKD